MEIRSLTHRLLSPRVVDASSRIRSRNKARSNPEPSPPAASGAPSGSSRPPSLAPPAATAAVFGAVRSARPRRRAQSRTGGARRGPSWKSSCSPTSVRAKRSSVAYLSLPRRRGRNSPKGRETDPTPGGSVDGWTAKRAPKSARRVASPAPLQAELPCHWRRVRRDDASTPSSRRKTPAKPPPCGDNGAGGLKGGSVGARARSAAAGARRAAGTGESVVALRSRVVSRAVPELVFRANSPAPRRPPPASPRRTVGVRSPADEGPTATAHDGRRTPTGRRRPADAPRQGWRRSEGVSARRAPWPGRVGLLLSLAGRPAGASEPPTRPNRREGPSGWLARRCGVSASDDEAIAMAMAVSRMCSEAVSAILCAGERFLVCARCACWARVSPFFRTSKTICGETKKG